MPMFMATRIRTIVMFSYSTFLFEKRLITIFAGEFYQCNIYINI
jgi:hypothetical protein